MRRLRPVQNPPAMPGQVSHGMGMILAGSGEKPLADSPIALQDDSAAALRFNLQRHESMLPCVRARPRLWERGGDWGDLFRQIEI